MRTPSANELIEFVESSNALEGFIPSRFGRRSRHAVFSQHLATAQAVAGGTLLEPDLIHARMMGGLLPRNEIPGGLRRMRLWIAGKEAPRPGDLQPLFVQFARLLDEGPGRAPAEIWCWGIHHHFQALHPFADGNGRVGRLLFNGLRQRHNLPWLTLGPADRAQYYSAIAAWRLANRR